MQGCNSMQQYSDYLGKLVQVVTANEAEYVGTLITIEDKGVMLEQEREDQNGKPKMVYPFIFEHSIDSIVYDPEGEYGY